MPQAAKAQTVIVEPTPLERLHRDRAAVGDELAALQASAARLRETANAEAAVLQEIGELGSAEIAVMTAWAANGCVGDPPAPDQKQRRALAEKLSTAQAAATAAKGAGQDIDQKIAEMSERLQVVDFEIEETVFAMVGAEHDAILTAYEANCEQGRKLAAKIHGLANFYGATGRGLIGRGNELAGIAYARRCQALTSIKLPNPGVSLLEIEAASAVWSRRFAALRRNA